MSGYSYDDGGNAPDYDDPPTQQTSPNAQPENSGMHDDHQAFNFQDDTMAVDDIPVDEFFMNALAEPINVENTPDIDELIYGTNTRPHNSSQMPEEQPTNPLINGINTRPYHSSQTPATQSIDSFMAQVINFDDESEDKDSTSLNVGQVNASASRNTDIHNSSTSTGQVNARPAFTGQQNVEVTAPLPDKARPASLFKASQQSQSQCPHPPPATGLPTASTYQNHYAPATRFADQTPNQSNFAPQSYQQTLYYGVSPQTPSAQPVPQLPTNPSAVENRSAGNSRSPRSPLEELFPQRKLQPPGIMAKNDSPPSEGGPARAVTDDTLDAPTNDSDEDVQTAAPSAPANNQKTGRRVRATTNKAKVDVQKSKVFTARLLVNDEATARNSAFKLIPLNIDPSSDDRDDVAAHPEIWIPKITAAFDKDWEAQPPKLKDGLTDSEIESCNKEWERWQREHENKVWSIFNSHGQNFRQFAQAQAYLFFHNVLAAHAPGGGLRAVNKTLSNSGPALDLKCSTRIEKAITALEKYAIIRYDFVMHERHLGLLASPDSFITRKIDNMWLNSARKMEKNAAKKSKGKRQKVEATEEDDGDNNDDAASAPKKPAPKKSATKPSGKRKAAEVSDAEDSDSDGSTAPPAPKRPSKKSRKTPVPALIKKPAKTSKATVPSDEDSEDDDVPVETPTTKHTPAQEKASVSDDEGSDDNIVVALHPFVPSAKKSSTRAVSSDADLDDASEQGDDDVEMADDDNDDDYRDE
ncbi:hypothetical protein Q7P37_008423 [Cladosporium fusiforme]